MVLPERLAPEVMSWLAFLFNREETSAALARFECDGDPGMESDGDLGLVESWRVRQHLRYICIPQGLGT